MADSDPIIVEPDPEPASTIWVWVALLAFYVTLGFFLKSLVLNWLVGPLFPLIVLYLIPKALGLPWGRS